LVWLAVTVGLTWAAPRFIAPLFNRFTAITDAALRQRVDSLLERCGFSAGGGVFVMDGSRRSAHGNAYFTGIGRNKRIVFFDTLLARIDLVEIEAVLAHELGHFSLHHVRQRLITSVLAALAGLWLLGLLARRPEFYAAFGVTDSAAMALLMFMFVIPPFAYFATPLAAWWSRRHERAADDFAIEHSSAAALVSALLKLYRDNATTLTPDPLHSAFYDSHPGAVERISRLKRAIARI
jgi:STE24 endopeptidase